MGEAVFPPCYLTWGQTMVEVMKIMPGVSYDKAEARVIMLLDKAAACPLPTSH